MSRRTLFDKMAAITAQFTARPTKLKRPRKKLAATNSASSIENCSVVLSSFATVRLRSPRVNGFRIQALSDIFEDVEWT